MTACPHCKNILACGCMTCLTYPSYVPRLVMIPKWATCPLCGFTAEVDLQIDFTDDIEEENAVAFHGSTES